MSDIIVGIDLGTTNSVAAIVENENPVIVPNDEGSNTTPSVVAFKTSGEVLLGEIAKRQAVSNPKNTVFSVKRLIGKHFSEVTDLCQKFPFKIVKDGNSAVIDIEGKKYFPQQISALILKKIKKFTENYLGKEVEKAVITVPAYFDDYQREATKEAGEIAGLEVIRIINEPTAAAIAYGLGKGREETIVVYDFGGGTFDISILDIDHDTFEVIATNGDTLLGGDNLDETLESFVAEQFGKKYGKIDLLADPVSVRRLKEACEKAKIELSTLGETRMKIPFIAYDGKTPLHLDTTIKRKQFENMIKDYVDKTLGICQKTLDEAGLKPADIKKVLLVGGSTRIPLVRKNVQEFFGKEPFKGVNPEEVVALGAATQAGVLAGQLQEVLLLDVTPFSLGIEVKSDSYSVIIPKNTSIPFLSSKIFTTTEDNQQLVNVHILQGEQKNASENKSLGVFSLRDITGAKAGEPRIKVTFKINVNGIVEIIAQDVQSGKGRSISVHHAFVKESEARRRRAEVPDVPAVATPETTSRTEAKEVVEEPAFEGTQREARKIAGGEEPVGVGVGETPKPSVGEVDTDKTVKMEKPSGLRDESEYEQLPDNLKEVETSILAGRKEAYVQSIYDVAIGEYEKLIKEGKNPSVAHIFLGGIHGLKGEFSACIEHLREALKLEPSRAKSVVHMLNMLIANYPENTTFRRKRLNLNVKQKSFNETIEDLNILLDTDDSDTSIQDKILMVANNYKPIGSVPTLALLVGRIYYHKARIDDAISVFQQVLESPAYTIEATKWLSRCFWQKKMYFLAYQNLIKLPEDTETNELIYQLSKDMIEARQYINARYCLESLITRASEFKDAKELYDEITEKLNVFQSSTIVSTQKLRVDDTEKMRFEILEEINRGSMGIIYKARDVILDEIVAIKILNEYLLSDPSAVERFKREARSARKLSHPNIVRIHDMFEFENRKIISMEFIQGKDLKSILEEKQTLKEDEIIDYLVQICNGLKYAHSMSIVHRDIKPANILISQEGMVLIADFGIVKIISEEATSTGSFIMGTPLYMAPEQIEGGKIDSRTDIYALGITLYQMANGSPPFREGNIAYQHIYSKPPPISNLSPELENMIMKCIAKKPEDRFQSIGDILIYVKQHFKKQSQKTTPGDGETQEKPRK